MEVAGDIHGMGNNPQNEDGSSITLTISLIEGNLYHNSPLLQGAINEEVNQILTSMLL
jgi:hypothetical protein